MDKQHCHFSKGVEVCVEMMHLGLKHSVKAFAVKTVRYDLCHFVSSEGLGLFLWHLATS